MLLARAEEDCIDVFLLEIGQIRHELGKEGEEARCEEALLGQGMIFPDLGHCVLCLPECREKLHRKL